MINKNTIKQYLKHIQNYVLRYKRLTISVIGLLALIIIVFVSALLMTPSNNKASQQTQSQSQQKHNQSKQQQKLYSEQLNDITSQLAKIEKTMSQHHKSSHSDQKMQKHIQHLRQDIQSTLNKIKQQNTHVSDQIKSGNDKLHSQLVKLNQSLSQLLAKHQHHKQLSPKQLPFTVKAIDNIQRSDVVTVQYNHHVIPLDESDALAGWRLKHADSSHQKAKFINPDNNYVLINLNQVSIAS